MFSWFFVCDQHDRDKNNLFGNLVCFFGIAISFKHNEIQQGKQKENTHFSYLHTTISLFCHLPAPTTTCHYLPVPTCNYLHLAAIINDYLPRPAPARRYLHLPAASCHCLQFPATTFAYHSTSLLSTACPCLQLTTWPSATTRSCHHLQLCTCRQTHVRTWPHMKLYNKPKCQTNLLGSSWKTLSGKKYLLLGWFF